MPFKPGQSGNPKGRPKKPLADDLRAFLDRRIAPGEPTRRQKVLEALYETALMHETAAIRTIFDRLDGAVPQPVQHTGPDGGPIVLQWQAVDE